MISHIDTQKCIGCGTCFKTCALGVFRMDTEQDCISPCMAACPAGNNIRKINSLLQESRFDEALECLVDTMPFPAIVGRVCPHPCESGCSRLEHDAAVNINGIENFLGELDLVREVKPVPYRHISKVAVVGSGPAGLSTAWYLTLAGYPVTVFEAREKPGGLLSYGIPEHRLPGSLVEFYIARLQNMGVEFRCNCALGNTGGMTLDNLDDLGFRAVVLAIGAGRGRPLPGAENAPHVVPGFPGAEIALTESGRIQADPLTLQTSLRTVFAAGDVVSGSGTVVQAIASGRRAAHSVCNILQGAHTHMGHPPRRETVKMQRLDKLESMKRHDRSHQETGISLSLDEALGEALRCITCGSKARIAYTDDCMTCFSCEMNCPVNAIDVSPFKQFYPRHLGKHFIGDLK